jgi:hypothetical protein
MIGMILVSALDGGSDVSYDGLTAAERPQHRRFSSLEDEAYMVLLFVIEYNRQQPNIGSIYVPAEPSERNKCGRTGVQRNGCFSTAS